jgi:hypothetical protein
VGIGVGEKKGPPLGIGGPGRRVSLPVSFSHRRVGSSILASLSEARNIFKNKGLTCVYINLQWVVDARRGP